ncbi:MAG: PEP/pyruvate-binding domain-containing protein, partial [Pseudomonadales bacterium]
VVQVMVPAQVSGVLFTANPTTGNSNELIVNSSFGLGEAIVGGEVSPDTFVLDSATLQTKQRVIGTKESLVVMAADHGTRSESVPESKRSTSSLTDDHLHKLAALGLQVEKIFAGEPQDIEWAIADGDYWLLQSRPITNLPATPLPDIWPLPPGAKKLVRRQVVENMPDPLSPLFADLYLRDCLDQGLDRFLSELGAPMVIEDFIERPFFLTSNGYAYCRADYRLSWKILGKIPKILYWYATSIGEIFRNIEPRWQEGLSSYLETVAQWQAVDPAEAPDQQLISGVRLLAAADAHYWFNVAIVMGMAKITDGLLHAFLSSASKHKKLTSGMFLHGFPSQTLQAQEHLESIAQQIQSDAGLCELVVGTSPEDLLDTLSRHTECRSISDSIQTYLELYGHQIYTLDFIQPTQQEDPLPVLSSLAALVNNPEYDTPARQAQMAEQRAALEAESLAAFGPIRRWLFRKFLRWAQIYG